MPEPQISFEDAIKQGGKVVNTPTSFEQAVGKGGSVEGQPKITSPLPAQTSADTLGGKIRNVLASGAEALGFNAPQGEGVHPLNYAAQNPAGMLNLGLTAAPFMGAGPTAAKLALPYAARALTRLPHEGVSALLPTEGIKNVALGAVNQDPYQTTQGVGQLGAFAAPFAAGAAKTGLQAAERRVAPYKVANREVFEFGQVDPKTQAVIAAKETIPARTLMHPLSGPPRAGQPKYDSPKASRTLATALGGKSSLENQRGLREATNVAATDLKKAEVEQLKRPVGSDKYITPHEDAELVAKTAKDKVWDDEIEPWLSKNPQVLGNRNTRVDLTKAKAEIAQRISRVFQTPGELSSALKKIDEKIPDNATVSEVEMLREQLRAEASVQLAKTPTARSAAEKTKAGQIKAAQYDVIRSALFDHVVNTQGVDVSPSMARYGKLKEIHQSLEKKPVDSTLLELITGKYPGASVQSIGAHGAATVSKLFGSSDRQIKKAFRQMAPAYKQGQQGPATVGQPKVPTALLPPQGGTGGPYQMPPVPGTTPGQGPSFAKGTSAVGDIKFVDELPPELASGKGPHEAKFVRDKQRLMHGEDEQQGFINRRMKEKYGE